MALEPAKILIVEDERVFAKNLKTYFQRIGWEARIAATGQAALIAVEEFLPDWILLDYELPDMTGLEMMQAVRAARHSCGCLLMTGHPTALMLEETKTNVGGHIVVKPFALAGLKTALQETVESSSALQTSAKRDGRLGYCGAAL
jgi:DNA-binding response OmpR family regulator